MEMPFGGTFSADTFATGTTAAAWGGTTTIVDFAVQAKGTSLLSTLDKWHSKADGNCAIDYGFHMIVSDVNDASLKEMEACVDAGVNTFKMFMAYPGVFYATDGEILRAMQKARDIGGDDHDARGERHRDRPTRRAGARRRAHRPGAARADPAARAGGRGHLAGRSHWRRSPARRCTSCTCPPRRRWTRSPQARDTGQNVFAETCPQYLFLSLEDLARPDFEGAKYVASPPLRPKEHQAQLWRGLRTNDLSLVSTDHCPFCFKDQKELGRGDFSKIPNGMPGVEHRMDLLHQGVVRGEISLPPLGRDQLDHAGPDVRSLSAQGRHRTRLGRRHRGVRPDRRGRPSRPSTHHMNVDYSAYEGMELTGKVAHRTVPGPGRDRRRRRSTAQPGTAGS